mgnify:CR=1 FL=1
MAITIFMFVFVISWAIVIIGLLLKNRFITSLAAISLIIVSLNGYVGGIPTVVGSVSTNYTNGTIITQQLIESQKDLTTEAMTLISLFAGLFLFIISWLFEGDAPSDYMNIN